FGLNRTRRSGFRREARAFFPDASKIEDVVDFRNLRALGPSVFPIPKQFRIVTALKEMLGDFLLAHQRPWPHNPDVFEFASIIRSRNSKMEEMEAFSRTLTFA